MRVSPVEFAKKFERLLAEAHVNLEDVTEYSIQYQDASETAHPFINLHTDATGVERLAFLLHQPIRPLTDNPPRYYGFHAETPDFRLAASYLERFP